MKTMNMISRRSFLKATAAAAVVSALSLTGCGSSGSSAAASDTASSAAGSAAAASEAGQTFKVGIVNYVDHASLNQIVASVESRLDKVGAEKGVTFDYADYYANAQADQSNLNQIGADLVADQVDVIVLWPPPLPPPCWPLWKIPTSLWSTLPSPILFPPGLTGRRASPAPQML